jgi:hypothetical protein
MANGGPTICHELDDVFELKRHIGIIKLPKQSGNDTRTAVPEYERLSLSSSSSSNARYPHLLSGALPSSPLEASMVMRKRSTSPNEDGSSPASVASSIHESETDSSREHDLEMEKAKRPQTVAVKDHLSLISLLELSPQASLKTPARPIQELVPAPTSSPNCATQGIQPSHQPVIVSSQDSSPTTSRLPGPLPSTIPDPSATNQPAQPAIETQQTRDSPSREQTSQVHFQNPLLRPGFADCPEGPIQVEQFVPRKSSRKCCGLFGRRRPATSPARSRGYPAEFDEIDSHGSDGKDERRGRRDERHLLHKYNRQQTPQKRSVPDPPTLRAKSAVSGPYFAELGADITLLRETASPTRSRTPNHGTTQPPVVECIGCHQLREDLNALKRDLDELKISLEEQSRACEISRGRSLRRRRSERLKEGVKRIWMRGARDVDGTRDASNMRVLSL